MPFRVVVYGGTGALGSSCVSFLKRNGSWVCSLGFRENPEADANVIITKRDSLEGQYNEVATGMKMILNKTLVDAVLCVAGGWVGGNCASEGFIRSVDTSIKQCVWSSTIAASISSTYLSPDGLFVLCGSHSALNATPEMIGYGLAKAAVHQLTSSLAGPGSGMPPRVSVITLLLDTLDTPMNLKCMPNGDTSTWTPLDFVNGLLFDWIQGKTRPKSGSLVKVVTKGGKSECLYDT